MTITIGADYDYDLDCDRSKRLNDILAGHDIALLKMVKKVTNDLIPVDLFKIHYHYPITNPQTTHFV